MAAGKGRKLVIVESPAKAKTIAGYLGGDFDVEASVGHIRDLPNPGPSPARHEEGPVRQVRHRRRQRFRGLLRRRQRQEEEGRRAERLLKQADEPYLATDEDREGRPSRGTSSRRSSRASRSSGWCSTITREAIQRAVTDTRELDTALVDAQETRRIVDRLYGYEVSPVLWRKVRQGLSAGRVQSVATRMVVERERERMAFRAASYWDVEGEFTTRSSLRRPRRVRRLHRPAQRRGRGPRRHRPRLRRHRRAEAQVGRPPRRGDGQGHCVRRPGGAGRRHQRPGEALHPPSGGPVHHLDPPTGGLAQLWLSSKNAMRVAQRLYENGYITYMRTDSITLSDSAITAARSQARDLYGADYVPAEPRRYAGRSRTRRRPTRRSARRATGSGRPPRWPASCAARVRPLRADLEADRRFADGRRPWLHRHREADRDARWCRGRAGCGVHRQRQYRLPRFLAAYEEGRDDGRQEAQGDRGGGASPPGARRARRSP